MHVQHNLIHAAIADCETSATTAAMLSFARAEGLEVISPVGFTLASQREYSPISCNRKWCAVDAQDDRICRMREKENTQLKGIDSRNSVNERDVITCQSIVERLESSTHCLMCVQTQLRDSVRRILAHPHVPRGLAVSNVSPQECPAFTSSRSPSHAKYSTFA